MFSENHVDDTKPTDDNKDSEVTKDSAEDAASKPATPSKTDAGDSTTRIKRSISESEEPNVPAKIIKV